MIFGYLVLLVAIIISAVSAFYSIVGLTAIFPGAFWPIVIMGSTLEIGKICAAVWLHRNWERASLTYKLYLVPAVVVLMSITSMGIYGGLSKAHFASNVPVGDIAAQVQMIDDQIAVKKTTIDQAKASLAQLDATFAQSLTQKSNRAAQQANSLRKSQANERTALQEQINSAQSDILALQKQKAPIEAQSRKLEADVGPLKYIAALIYGDQASHDLLEKAVRWVIILIVSVFDPLAMVLILAGSKHIEWHKQARKEEEKPEIEPVSAPSPIQENTVESTVATDVHENTQPMSEPEPSATDKELAEDYAALQSAWNDLFNEKQILLFQMNQLQLELEDAQIDCNRKDQMLESLQADMNNLSELYQESILREQQPNVDHQENDIDALREEINNLSQSLSTTMDHYNDLHEQLLAAREIATTSEAEKSHYESLIEELKTQLDIERNTNSDHVNEIKTLTNLVEQLSSVIPTENIVEPSNSLDDHDIAVGFGSTFPQNPNNGDMFLRVDFDPFRAYKWNGVKWIEVDKNSTDVFSYNQQYITYLAEKLMSGEYAIDDLSDIDYEQVQIYLESIRDKK